MKIAHMVAFVPVIIGGLNWLLFGLFDWEIGELFGGMDAMISKLIYIIVGVAAIYEVATHKKNCKVCGGASAPIASSSMGSTPSAGNQM